MTSRRTAPARRIELMAGPARRALGLLIAVSREAIPPASQRCSRSPLAGVHRWLLAVLRQLRRSDRYAIVRLAPGVAVRADLRAPHGRRLFAYGFCEPAAFLMRDLLRPGDVVIDGGANIGLYTLIGAASVGPTGRVIACEPSPANMDLLRDNVRLNDFDWVDLHEVALAAQAGQLTLHVFQPGSGYNSFAPADRTSGREIDVDVTTLDAIAGAYLDRTALVKLDTEGAELLALRGAPQLLQRARPDFIIELEPEHLARQGSSIRDIQELFVAAGYSGFTIVNGALQAIEAPWTRPAGDPNIVVRPRERTLV
jgi:FkbM family methyltransferase